MLVYVGFCGHILSTSRWVNVILIIFFFWKYFLLGTPARCANGVCQAGTCFEQTIGSTIFAYCNCNPGWAGRSCELCLYLLIIYFEFKIIFLLGYFTCTQAGVFPDTANCRIGRYFYCPQASGGKYFPENPLLMLMSSSFL